MKNIFSVFLFSMLAIVSLIAIGSVFQEDEPQDCCIVENSIEEDKIDNLDDDIGFHAIDDSNGMTDFSDHVDKDDVSKLNNSSVDDDDEKKHVLITKYTLQKANLMSEADSLSSIIGVVPKGTPVQLYEDCDCEWICIAYNNHYGYVNSTLLDGHTPNAPPNNDHVAGYTNRLTITSNADAPKSSSNRSFVPEGATALCRDGTYSFSKNRRGTCSWHGGVAKWLR